MDCPPYLYGLSPQVTHTLYPRRQAVRRRTLTPIFVGSIPTEGALQDKIEPTVCGGIVEMFVCPNRQPY